ncbi:polysaccharide deacetylase family protein [Arcticibacter pallidicorallinus]|uniref:polysaccharide deacetylase family protein n=1 Tax=Arcticibacter pallidicorallinus TaxID=1259464 RepID=UPI0031840CAC
MRGDLSQKTIALVFTGDEFADGSPEILRTLKKHRTQASFFLTGNFYAKPAFRSLIRDIRKSGHYLGAHSDKHLLYADWVKRDSLLVTEDEFKKDLLANYSKMLPFGVGSKDAPYFIPPYEWYNKQIVSWTEDLGLQVVNFSPGTSSTADYTYPEMGKSYRSSAEIYDSILDFEKGDPHGLNGFILLVHIGTDPRRKDKFYDKLDQLLTELKAKQYTFVKINKLLD